MPTITKVYPIYTVWGLEASLINFVENNLYCLHHDQDYILNKDTIKQAEYFSVGDPMEATLYVNMKIIGKISAIGYATVYREMKDFQDLSRNEFCVDDLVIEEDRLGYFADKGKTEELKTLIQKTLLAQYIAYHKSTVETWGQKRKWAFVYVEKPINVEKRFQINQYCKKTIHYLPISFRDTMAWLEPESNEMVAYKITENLFYDRNAHIFLIKKEDGKFKPFFPNSKSTEQTKLKKVFIETLIENYGKPMPTMDLREKLDMGWKDGAEFNEFFRTFVDSVFIRKLGMTREQWNAILKPWDGLYWIGHEV